MSDQFRRILGRSWSQADQTSRLPSRAEDVDRERSTALPDVSVPDSRRRSDEVNTQPQEPSAADAAPRDVERNDEREFASPVGLGEHVTAVVASAQQAAEQIRAAAVSDAERIRDEAREEANSRIAEATREAEKMRTESGAYSREVRQDADAYAAEKRGDAEAYASRLRAEAEEAARQTREAAKQDAKRAEKDSHRRRQILSSEMERFEERLRSLHTVFQGMTSQLENLLPKSDAPGEEEERSDEMEETLKRGATERAAS